MSGSGGPRVRSKDLGRGRHGPRRAMSAVFDRIFSTGRPQGVWSSDAAARRAAAQAPVPPATDRVPLARGDGTVFIPLAGSGLPGQRHVRQAAPALGPGSPRPRQPIGAGQPVGGVLVRPASQAYWARRPDCAVHTYPLAPEPEPGPDGRVPTGQPDVVLGRFLRSLRRTTPLLPPGPAEDDADEEAWGNLPWAPRARQADPFLAHELALAAVARAATARPTPEDGRRATGLAVDDVSDVAERRRVQDGMHRSSRRIAALRAGGEARLAAMPRLRRYRP